MANIVNFTDKQFENRLNDNLEELVQGKKAVESPTAFLLCAGHGTDSGLCVKSGGEVTYSVTSFVYIMSYLKPRCRSILFLRF